MVTLPSEAVDAGLESQIARWRDWLRRRPALRSGDVAELEAHLRDQIAALTGAGLADDEAFLVAVKRMGSLDAVSREFAREHSDRLWKQLVAAPEEENAASGRRGRREVLVVLGLAAAAAVLVQVPRLFGAEFGEGAFYALNASLFALPLLTGYFAWKRGIEPRRCLWLALAFAAAAVAVNTIPFEPGGSTEALAAMHLPIALWLAVGFAYVGGRWWGNVAGRMDFVRFSGELFIYFVLMALGGGVLTAFTIVSFEAIGFDVEGAAQLWILPSGAMGAVLVGAWLVEAKQSVVENMAPVLTRIFTPLFAVLLVTLLGAMAWTGRGVGLEREVLIAFDLLLAIVLGLLLYAISARDPLAPPDLFDRILLVLVASALIADGVALAAILGRISEFGFSPNRVAALGENLVLAVNLAWSGWLYARFALGRGPFAALERWQTAYLPVFAGWAAFVVVAFPLIFRFA